MVTPHAVPDQHQRLSPVPPLAPVASVRVDPRGARTVVVECPFCEGHHVHGWPINSTKCRTTHCGAGGAGRSYEFDIADDHVSTRVAIIRVRAITMRARPDIAADLRDLADILEQQYARKP